MNNKKYSGVFSLVSKSGEAILICDKLMEELRKQGTTEVSMRYYARNGDRHVFYIFYKSNKNLYDTLINIDLSKYLINVDCFDFLVSLFESDIDVVKSLYYKGSEQKSMGVFQKYTVQDIHTLLDLIRDRDIVDFERDCYTDSGSTIICALHLNKCPVFKAKEILKGILKFINDSE